VVVVLAGGSGGARLARGMLDVVGAGELTVIANTGDDVEMYGVHVSPDPDLVTWWLADLIDERGWGIAGDTWQVMDALAEAGRPPWFRLGDRDLAMCLLRTEVLRGGGRLSDGQAEVSRAVGVQARVLPMCDEPVRTRVKLDGRWLAFQEFMISESGKSGGVQIEGVELDGIEAARPTPEVVAALADADAIVIGPSNPVISIGPILELPGMRDAIAAAAAPVVAVSPFVGGRAIKGPTEDFCRYAGLPLGTGCAIEAYAGLIQGVVADEPGDGVPVHVTETLMDSPEARHRLAEETLEFAGSVNVRK
jgi:LPPG:FO 2-phospho-L-lactate transferase